MLSTHKVCVLSMPVPIRTGGCQVRLPQPLPSLHLKAVCAGVCNQPRVFLTLLLLL